LTNVPRSDVKFPATCLSSSCGDFLRAPCLPGAVSQCLALYVGGPWHDGLAALPFLPIPTFLGMVLLVFLCEAHGGSGGILMTECCFVEIKVGLAAPIADVQPVR
jgi:hypothetical protein